MSDDVENVAGASAAIFQEMTRQTIIRKIKRLTTEQLLDLLGHLIIRERAGK
jgi:acid phosphatase family membrane protein YuiD